MSDATPITPIHQWTHDGTKAASSTGWSGVAAVTGEYSTVEAGPGGICAVAATEVVWVIHPEAVLIQRWPDKGKWHTKVLTPERKWQAGDRVTIKAGKVIKHEKVRP